MTFDLIVIGTGSAGSTVARRCRSAGWNVAIVDSRPYGGTCTQRGCDPKKVLVGAAEAVHAARRLNGRDVAGDNVAIRWPDLAQFKRTFTDPVAERSAQGFAEAGIETLHGRARFVGRNAIRVGERVREARHLHVATGAMPARLGIAGEDLLTSSDQFLELTEMPHRIVFLGSGFISFEFAHVCATAGAQVTMIEMLDRPLAGFDPDLVSVVVEGTRAMGIELYLHEGRVVAANLLEGNTHRIDYPAVPSVVFTLPPLAMVGLQESEARAQGLRFTTSFARTAEWYSSRRLGERCSGHKVLVEDESGRILGAHLLGPNSEEPINVFAVAMRCGLRASDLKELIFAYPTRASDVAYMV